MWSTLCIKLLPPLCLLCGKISQRARSLCLPCEQDLPELPPHCAQCAHIIPILDNISNPRLDVRCGRCQQDPPPFDRTVALFPYESPIVQLIKGLKFQRRLSVAKLLGELFVERLKALCLPRPDLILPMPLHPTRLRERGFNQALEIARPIGRALRLPIDLAGAERIKQTAAQSTLSNEARKRNVAHAFELKKHYRGATIAVLDDVMTTQYTMIALCQLLKQAQAKQVIVWCAARAMHQVA